MKKNKERLSHHEKTYARQARLRDIFKERFPMSKGLTKEETISQYYNLELTKVLNFNKEKINNLWEEIKGIKHALLKEHIIPIISRRIQRGFVLQDSNRRVQIDSPKFIYFRCITSSDANIYSSNLDRVGEGFHNSATNVKESILQEARDRPIFERIIQKTKQ